MIHKGENPLQKDNISITRKEQKMSQKRINIALSEELENYFREKAAASGQSLASVIGLTLYEYYNSQKVAEKMRTELDTLKLQFDRITEIAKQGNPQNPVMQEQ